MSNFQSARLRIKRANTYSALVKLETSFTRVYDAGHLTAPELSRLYTQILEKLVAIEATKQPVISR